jgi:hypothetical protein
MHQYYHTALEYLLHHFDLVFLGVKVEDTDVQVVLDLIVIDLPDVAMSGIRRSSLHSPDFPSTNTDSTQRFPDEDRSLGFSFPKKFNPCHTKFGLEVNVSLLALSIITKHPHRSPSRPIHSAMPGHS